MSRNAIAILILATLSLSACKKAEDKPADDRNSPPTGVLGAATDKAKVKSAAAALPQPDPAKPLSTYPEIDRGMQIMFLYVAASRLPPDLPKLAAVFSSEYRETNDSFRKNDLMAAIKPQVEIKIAEARTSPYGWMDIDDSDNLGAYDFERKGFAVEEFQSARHRYINDASDYKLGWANHNQVAFAPVADEAVARQLEAMRTDYGNKPRLKIYFFAQSADLNSQKVNAIVTRVQITDKSGRVLAEYGPDARVAPQQPSPDEGCGADAWSCDAGGAAADAAAG